MRPFAELLDRLAYTSSRNGKLKLMRDYFERTPDPDRGWALAALTDGLPLSFPVRRTLLDIVGAKIDEELFRLSRDYVGDTAETVALLWPGPTESDPDLHLGRIVEELRLVDRNRLGPLLAQWLDRLDATGRWALLKLVTGALRVGVSARLAKTAVAELGRASVDDVEEIWHGLAPPYGPLFAWLAGRGPRPDITGIPVFRPMMLSHPLEAEDLAALDVDDYQVEWKWDGIRVQIACGRGETRLYSRTGEDIAASFPEIVQAFRAEGVFDGELLVVRGPDVAPFSDLQKRLNRKQVGRKLMADNPAHIRFYDALTIGDEDIRAMPLVARRARLEDWHARARPPLSDVSEVLAITGKDQLQDIWNGTRGIGIEGLMLKRKASPYIPGRPKGHWWKWKRATLTLDVVLMYAQRGSGKRSSYYSDFTFGAWTDGPEGQPVLVPVGKAYSGYTDAELLRIDKWIRNNTAERFGPVRRVEPALVLEVEFDSVQRSTRHKSGVAMRFPRIHRIRWDKPAWEADRLETLTRMIVTADGEAPLINRQDTADRIDLDLDQ